jgi:hypothetical protein
MRCWLLLLVVLSAIIPRAIAQETYGYSLSGHYGFTIAHSSRITNLKSTNPIGIQLDLYRQKAGKESFDMCHCFPQSGVNISYFDYGNDAILGQGIHTNLYIEPQFKMWGNTYFLVRATAGLAWMNRPYDEVENPNNLSYSLPISAFLSIGPGIKSYVNERTSLFAIVPFNHVSNGGIKDPNLGLNFPGVQFGLSRDVNALQRYSGKQNRNYFAPKTFFTVSPFWTSRTVKNGEKKRYSIYGMELGYSYQRRPLLSWNVAGEFYRDEALQERYNREQGIDEARYRAGMMGGILLHLGKFELSHRVGAYVYDPGLYDGRIFHRHGIMYKVSKHWLFGVNMKAHWHVANFLDFRASYRW